MYVQLNSMLNYINMYVSWFLAWGFPLGNLEHSEQPSGQSCILNSYVRGINVPWSHLWSIVDRIQLTNVSSFIPWVKSCAMYFISFSSWPTVITQLFNLSSGWPTNISLYQPSRLRYIYIFFSIWEDLMLWMSD